MNESIFKAYDIRGNYPQEINEEVAYQIGKSYGSYLQEMLDKQKCVIGHDNRISSPSITKALTNGLLDSGINVIDYGEITTPMHYYTRYKEKTFGIMVTASHNPKDDNGFKFSFDEYSNARGEMIDEFKEFTFKENFKTGHGMYIKRNIKEDYLNYLKTNIDMGPKKLNVVVDAGNGVTTTIMKEAHILFPNLQVTYICDQNDGTFPNHHPDPAVEENLEMLKAKVKELHADIGIAYDGDGDRLGIIDDLGNFIPADKYLIVAIRSIIKNVEKKTFLCDVKCSKALLDEINNLQGTVYMSRTGTSFTEKNTIENHIPLGGELSGHIFFNDRGKEVCSAIYAGLRFLEILSKTDKKFHELLENIPVYYSTPEIKIPVANEKKFDVVEKVIQYARQKKYNILDIDGARINFPNSWALIRASNTGPNLTIRFEATTKEELEEKQKEFTEIIQKYIS